jgi:tight adherence protein C
VVSAALAFAAAGFAIAGLMLLVPGARVRRSGRGDAAEAASGRGDGTAAGSASAKSRASRLLRLLVFAGARLRAGGAAPPRDLAARIAAAGAPGGLGARELMAAKVAAALAGGLLGALAASLAPGRLGALLLVGAPLGGFLGPDFWLARRARSRARVALRALPAMLDLLRVAIEAGASLPTAHAAVGERARGPLAGEWRAVGREVALGARVEDALAGMAARLPIPEVRSLVAALERARRHGAPLSETLAAQARDARSALRRQVREEGARAGPKMQLVVALLLVPSVLLLVAAALTAALLDTGGGLVPL